MYKHAALAAALLASPIAAQPAVDDLKSKVADYTALMDAENGKSALCKGYLGKVVRVGNFDVVSSARASAGPIVMALPTDRDHIHYDANAHAITISAGAFQTGAFSDEPQAEVAAEIAIQDHIKNGLAVPYAQSERVISTSMARNVLGTPIKVSDVERHTKGLYLQAPHLFSFARDDRSTVMGLDAPVAQASRLKQTIRVALLIEPEAPYLLSGSISGATATSRVPVHYIERSSVLVVNAKCGLVLDGQARVLASVDAG